MLTVNKGFFETLAAKGRTEGAAAKSGTAMTAGDDGDLDADALEGAGWCVYGVDEFGVQGDRISSRASEWG